MKNKGQVGPFSLEVLFPMVIAIIIISVFIVFTLSTTMGNLKQRKYEEMHNAAENTASVLYSKSIFVYGNNPGLFAIEQLDGITCEKLNSMYATTGYTYTIEIMDTSDDTLISAPSCPNTKEDLTAIATPIAIRYSEDNVHTGTLKVKIWQK